MWAGPWAVAPPCLGVGKAEEGALASLTALSGPAVEPGTPSSSGVPWAGWALGELWLRIPQHLVALAGAVASG